MSPADYARAIEALIPRAARAAAEATGLDQGMACSDEDAAEWSRVFHTEMDRLAAAAGLRAQSWQTGSGVHAPRRSRILVRARR